METSVLEFRTARGKRKRVRRDRGRAWRRRWVHTPYGRARKEENVAGKGRKSCFRGSEFRIGTIARFDGYGSANRLTSPRNFALQRFEDGVKFCWADKTIVPAAAHVPPIGVCVRVRDRPQPTRTDAARCRGAEHIHSPQRTPPTALVVSVRLPIRKAFLYFGY